MRFCSSFRDTQSAGCARKRQKEHDNGDTETTA
jgi:hypothetical protein